MTSQSATNPFKSGKYTAEEMHDAFSAVANSPEGANEDATVETVIVLHDFHDLCRTLVQIGAPSELATFNPRLAQIVATLGSVEPRDNLHELFKDLDNCLY